MTQKVYTAISLYKANVRVYDKGMNATKTVETWLSCKGCGITITTARKNKIEKCTSERNNYKHVYARTS